MAMPSGTGGGFGAVATAVDEIDVKHLHDLPAFGAAHAGASHRRTGLEILMPGLAQCRYMQERVAVIGVEG